MSRYESEMEATGMTEEEVILVYKVCLKIGKGFYQVIKMQYTDIIKALVEAK